MHCGGHCAHFYLCTSGSYRTSSFKNDLLEREKKNECVIALREVKEEREELSEVEEEREELSEVEEEREELREMKEERE
ncbi:histone H3.v1-like, partial [Pimephales promelas]|uniref:histone H3.v1-like n=1 Tax=Pimephales promelas TaxID=90988 RepID=UPI001955B74B